MHCWVCEAPAHGICRFCGRAVCRQHARTAPYLLAVLPHDGKVEGLGVDHALHCGICHPHPEPVPLEFLVSGGPQDDTS